ncbi:MAG: hypothetical protein IJU81_06780 [Bacteroidales bacterium]|nr:hypothetical protein [Bacteroidales bacterium]
MTNTTPILKARPVATIAVDALLIAAACAIPAASHLLGLPLYKANPMLALLLAGIWLGRDWRNGLALALLLPLASSLLSGMPQGGKAVCIIAELTTVSALFGWLGAAKKIPTLPAILTAILCGKTVYYALKALILAPSTLIGTEWWIQALTIVLWGGLFTLLSEEMPVAFRQRSGERFR